MVALELGGGRICFLERFEDILGDFEVSLGSFAWVCEGRECHGGMIRGAGAKWNSQRGAKRAL